MWFFGKEILKEKVKIAFCKEHLDPVPRAEAYSGPCQTSIIQIFALTNFEYVSAAWHCKWSWKMTIWATPGPQIPHCLDTVRKWNVYKTFRRRIRYLLNVLWTSNLRPVSRGYIWLPNCFQNTAKLFPKLFKEKEALQYEKKDFPAHVFDKAWMQSCLLKNTHWFVG